jgi:hypothetical protein
MGDHDALNLWCDQQRLDPAGQFLPHSKTHVLAVQLGHLFRQDVTRAIVQARNCGQQLVHAHLPSLVANIVRFVIRFTGNSAPCAQNHYFFTTIHCHDLQTFKNWLKIQLLDIDTANYGLHQHPRSDHELLA